MSEPVHTSETPATDAPEPQPTPEQTPAPEAPAEPKPTETVDFWKRKAREQEERAKANAKAAEKLKEIEDRDLSELQKAQRDREDALTRLASLEQEALRYSVAAEFGISKADADEWLIGGGDAEALTRKAQRFNELRGKAAPTSPRPDPGQGPRPTSPEMDEENEYKRFFPNG